MDLLSHQLIPLLVHNAPAIAGIVIGFLISKLPITYRVPASLGLMLVSKYYPVIRDNALALYARRKPATCLGKGEEV